MEFTIDGKAYTKLPSPVHGMRCSRGIGAAFFAHRGDTVTHEIQLIGTDTEIRDLAVALLTYVGEKR